MIEKLRVKQYRKLKDLDFDFSNNMNLISGGNGTCKSSLLYLISNSFSKVKNSNPRLKNDKCLKKISDVLTNLNLKMESLTRDPNVPLDEVKGTIYTATYENGISLDFRKHNSVTGTGKNRFAMKPKYADGNHESIPQIPVVYLGLSRLYSYGEYLNDDMLKSIKNSLPASYISNIQNNFKEFTNVDVTISNYEQMGDIKNRVSFSSTINGYDSNTISAGEDNLMIIFVALEAMHYYYDSVNASGNNESVFLIDEMDATLHPDYQIKMLNLFKKYADDYKIKFIFTSHSLTTIEYCLDKKYNVLYLVNNFDLVSVLKDPNKYSIKALLHNKLRDDVFANSCIPIFMEDDESRDLLDSIFEVYQENNPDFSKVKSYFYLPQIKVSCEALKQMFMDSKLAKNFIHSICILDGDMHGNVNKANSIIALPKDKSPEEMVFGFMESLYSVNDSFTMNNTLLEAGFTKTFYLSNIKNRIDDFNNKEAEKKAQGKSTNGDRREFTKELYNSFKTYFIVFFKEWARRNTNEINKFMEDLKQMFMKNAPANNVPISAWNF